MYYICDWFFGFLHSVLTCGLLPEKYFNSSDTNYTTQVLHITIFLFFRLCDKLYEEDIAKRNT